MPPRKKKVTRKNPDPVVASLPQSEIIIDPNEMDRHRVSSLAKEDSVIMLSSAENTMIGRDPSLLMLTTVDMLRPSTRLGSIDMTLEETVRPSFRPSARPPLDADGNETNMSIINIDQTPCIARNRTKSSWVIRRTEGSGAFLNEIDTVRPVRNRQPNRNVFGEDFQTTTNRTSKPVAAPEKKSKRGAKKTAKENMSLISEEPNLNATPVSIDTNVVAISRIGTRSASRAAKFNQNVCPTRSAKSREKSVETDDGCGDSNTQKTKQGKLRKKQEKQNNRISDSLQSNKTNDNNATENSSQNNKIQNVKNVTSQSKERQRRKKPPELKEVDLSDPVDPTGSKSKNKNAGEAIETMENYSQNLEIAAAQPQTRRNQQRKRPTDLTENISSPPKQQATLSESNEDNISSSKSDSASSVSVPAAEVEKSKETNQFSYVSVRRRPRIVTRSSAVNEIGPGNSQKSINNSLPATTEDVNHENIHNSADLHNEFLQLTNQSLEKRTPPNVSKRKRPNLTSQSDRSNADEAPDTTVEKSPTIEKVFSDNLCEKSPLRCQEPTLGEFDLSVEKNVDLVVPFSTGVTIRGRSRMRRMQLVSSTDPVNKKQSEFTPALDSDFNGRSRTRQGHSIPTPHSPEETDSQNNIKVSNPELQISGTKRSQTASSSPTIPIQDSTIPKPRGRSRTRKVQPVSLSKSSKETSNQSANTLLQQAPSTKRHQTRSRSTVRSKSPLRSRAPVQDSTVPKSRGRSRTRKIQPVTVLNSSKEANSQSNNDLVPETSNTKGHRTRSQSTLRSNVKSQTHVTDGTTLHPESPTPSTASITTKSRVRSKSTLRSNAKPAATRSRSVPRNALLSPVAQQPPTNDGSHIPVYRRQLEKEDTPVQTKRVKKLKKSAAQSAPTGDDDIYAFDSPSQTPPIDGEQKPTKKRTATRKKTTTRSVNSGTTRKRITPAKKAHHFVFGTDMAQIGKVVRKIGGGPIHHPSKTMDDVFPTAKLASLVLRPASPRTVNPSHRSDSPVSSHPGDHHDDNDFDVENIPDVDVPEPLSPPKMPNTLQRILQPRKEPPVAATPDNRLTFSPLGASSPWRVQSENVLPKTFYFSRSKDLLPSYESDIVIRHDDHQAKSPIKDIQPMVMPLPARKTSPTQTVGPKPPPEVMFRNIQKSYEQLKVTSEMSEKLITAMRKYKENLHSRSTLFTKSPDGLSEDERLIAQFREYEQNMKKTYQKLKQWYERSQRTLKHSMQAIEEVSTLPKTQAQKEVLQNFHRHSEQFITMINELESAMNDSNVENVAPPKSLETVSNDVVLSERDVNNPYRSPLKTLSIINVPRRFSPVKSPLVKASFNAFSSSSSSSSKQNATKSRDRFSILSLSKPPGMRPPTIGQPSVIEIAETMAHPDPPSADALPDRTTVEDKEPTRDLFGFETDTSADDFFVRPTPVKITKDTLRERLKSVRKMLPTKTYSRKQQQQQQQQHRLRVPKIIGSPSKLRSVQSVFASSTPVAAGKRTQAAPDQAPDMDVSIIPDKSALGSVEPAGKSDSPPVVLFDEPEREIVASTSLSCVNRTYSRIPRRNHKRKRNIYLADLGLSDDDDEEGHEGDNNEDCGRTEAAPSEEEEDANGELNRKQANKKRRIVTKRKKKTVEQSKEFKKFVEEFNGMCEEVNRYQLVVE